MDSRSYCIRLGEAFPSRGVRMRFVLILSVMTLTACPANPGSCAATCVGCCDDTNTCRQGNDVPACGTAGGQCLSCNTGDQCVLGQCRPSGSGGGASGGGGTSRGGGAG